MDGTALPSLPSLVLHVTRDQVDATEIVSNWLAKLNQSFNEKEFTRLPELFIEDCWWRDILGLAWDFSSKHGYDAVEKYLSGSRADVADLKASTGGLKPVLIELAGQTWVQSGFSFTNRHGRGQGFVRLINVRESEWKAWIMFTQLEELNFQKEVEERRILSHAASARTSGARMPEDPGSDPDVLIIGAGEL